MSGALGGGYGESSSKQGYDIIPFTEAELELQGINLDVARQQLQAIIGQQAVQQQLAGLFTSQLGQQRGLLDQSGEISAAAMDRLQQVIQGGGISDEQSALLDQIEANALESIRGGTQENLQLLRQELAPQLGLRSADSPILDRGALIAREGLRQESGARAARAQAELSLPQQEAAFLSQLQNQDFLQRLNLGQQTTQGGLGLANTGNAVGAAEFRPNVATTGESSSFNFNANTQAAV